MPIVRRSYSRWFFVAVLTLGWSIGILSQAQSGDDHSGVKRALLIGINKYRGVPGLQGSINDIETMRRILITRWGFAERYIVMLTDEAATRAGILAALERLIKDTGSNDTVYVHYSGHGSQVVDLSGDEKDDGLDETLVPQDGRTGDVRDITDDELNEIFSRLKARVGFIVLDSCHSGTATRSLNIRTRSVPQDMRQYLYEQYERSKIMTRGAVVSTISSRYVLMTGAASHQEALDGPIDGRYHGFFSFALSKSLSSLSIDASPREIFGGIEQEFKRIQTHLGRSSMPEPQLEAPRDLLDKSLFGPPSPIAHGSGAAIPRLVWADVQPGEAGQVVLTSGLLLGTSPGSSWSVYPPGETTFSPGRALGIATVLYLNGKDAIAQLHPAGVAIKRGSRAVALLPASTGERLPIRILNAPKDRREHVEDTLRRVMPNIELVGDEKAAKFLVDARGVVLRLLSAEGLELVGSFRTDSEDWGAGMALVMSRSVNASELLALDNPSSQLKVDVHVSNGNSQKPAVTTRGITVIVGNTSPSQYRIRRENEHRTVHNSLQLEVRVNTDAYVTVVDVDSEGGVNLLFPNDYQESSFYADGFARGGDTIHLPDSLEPGNRAGFYWDYGPPKGMDTIQVFASTDLETAGKIRRRIQSLQGTTKRHGDVTIPEISANFVSLRDDLARLALGGTVIAQEKTATALAGVPKLQMEQPASSKPLLIMESPVKLAASDWAAASVQIVVSE